MSRSIFFSWTNYYFSLFIFVLEDDSSPSIDEPPEYLNATTKTFWWISQAVRDTLTSAAWKDKVKEGNGPYFCMHEGFCKYFDGKAQLDKHWTKKPEHNCSFPEMEALSKQIMEREREKKRIIRVKQKQEKEEEEKKLKAKRRLRRATRSDSSSSPSRRR